MEWDETVHILWVFYGFLLNADNNFFLEQSGLVVMRNINEAFWWGVVSHSFGYGLMDAGAMVKLAKRWKTVPAQHKCEIKAPYSDK